MTLDFLASATNAILVGASGLGKTMIAQNIAHQAVLQGHTVLFATAGQLLGELAGLDSDSALRYRCDAMPRPICRWSTRWQFVLFEPSCRSALRVDQPPAREEDTLITTNRSFSEWSEVFPNASCVVAMIDRLVHHAEILSIKGASYRRKEAQSRRTQVRKRKTKGSS